MQPTNQPMKDFQEKQKKTAKRKKYSKTLLLIMTLALVLLIKGVFSVYSKEQESQSEIDRIQSQKAELQKRYENITEQSDALKSDTGVESEIRNKFDVLKQGEGVIVIVDKEMPIIQEDNRSVLKKFWDSVKGVFGGGASSTTSTGEAKNGKATSTIIRAQ